MKPCREKILRITIPEDLDYNELFDDLFEKYTTHSDTISVKTSNMGSMFKLTYNITLKDPANEKEFIDALRCRMVIWKSAFPSRQPALMNFKI